MIKQLILTGAGGGIGAMLRFLFYLAFRNSTLPITTLLINVAGSFVLGIVLALSLKNNDFPEGTKIFLATGICGGFTTFSAFSAENLQLIQAGKTSIALAYIGLSVCVGIFAVWLGFKMIS